MTSGPARWRRVWRRPLRRVRAARGEVEQRVDDPRVELVVGHAGAAPSSASSWPRAGRWGRGSVIETVGVRRGHDAGLQRDVLARQAVGVAPCRPSARGGGAPSLAASSRPPTRRTTRSPSTAWCCTTGPLGLAQHAPLAPEHGVRHAGHADVVQPAPPGGRSAPSAAPGRGRGRGARRGRRRRPRAPRGRPRGTPTREPGRAPGGRPRRRPRRPRRDCRVPGGRRRGRPRAPRPARSRRRRQTTSGGWPRPTARAQPTVAKTGTATPSTSTGSRSIDACSLPATAFSAPWLVTLGATTAKRAPSQRADGVVTRSDRCRGARRPRAGRCRRRRGPRRPSIEAQALQLQAAPGRASRRRDRRGRARRRAAPCR